MTDVKELARPPAARQAAIDDRKAGPLRALKVLRRIIVGDPEEDDSSLASLDLLLEYFCLSRCNGDCDSDDVPGRADDFETAEMQEALARARCGETADCIIHLGRALPQEYGAIADHLERALGSAR